MKRAPLAKQKDSHLAWSLAVVICLYSDMTLIIVPGVVRKLCDLLGARLPTHVVAFGLKFCDVDHGAIGLHGKGRGEGLTAVFVYHHCRLGQVVEDIFMP